MINAAVVGATGYAGAELVRILCGHPKVRLTLLTSRQYAGKRFDEIYPSMAGLVELICQPYSAELVCDQADVIFLALPHKLPMKIVPDLMAAGKYIIDLSADFRYSDLSLYENFYQPHTAKAFNDQAVYGLSEVNTTALSSSKLIGNPGCYPTSVLLPLIPLLMRGMIKPNGIIADAKSGVSGAGRTASLTTHICQVTESFKAYKVGTHRHTSEMEENLSKAAGSEVKLTFVPHLLPMSRGMEATIYTRPKAGITLKDIRNCLEDFYRERYFIRILKDGAIPDTLNVRGTNFCDIGFHLDLTRGCLTLLAVIDNLVKGAAGQAVQNMNLMLGFEESTGLTAIPFPM
jgi:N-acetyl-gamma-glutamyl-phosphate reductase